METFTVEGQIREGRGKGPARRTRMTGMVPAVLYGARKESISLAVNAKQVARILRSETGHNTIFSVKVAGGSEEKAMLKDWQVDPVSNALLHVDLLRIAMDVQHARPRAGAHIWRAAGREDAGRRFRDGHARSRNRVLAGRHSGRIPRGRQRVPDRQAASRRATCRSIQQKIKLLTDPTRVLAHVVMLKKEEEPVAEAAVATETARGRARSHQEGQEGNRRRRSRGRRRSRAEGAEKKGKKK